LGFGRRIPQGFALLALTLALCGSANALLSLRLRRFRLKHAAHYPVELLRVHVKLDQFFVFLASPISKSLPNRTLENPGHHAVAISRKSIEGIMFDVLPITKLACPFTRRKLSRGMSNLLVHSDKKRNFFKPLF
jgi:hypothetical protein